MLKLVSIFTILFSTTLMADVTLDKSEELNGVTLKSGKESDVRTYIGSTEKSFPHSLEVVKKGITNFTEKCNNSYKEKRQFTNKEIDCKYHNENLVESFIVTDINKTEELKKFSEAFVVGRQVYNRGSFGYYELATMRPGKNEKNQRTLTIHLKMLNNEEVKQYISPKFSKESAFDESTSVYTLTEVSPQETLMRYEYSANTDHWILNKEISVPQVFASISKSINDLISTVETETSLIKRELASQD